MKPLSLNAPHLIVMTGIPGSGKSFFAERFSSTFKAPIVSFERLRAELFNNPSYSTDEQIILGRVADYLLDELMKTGQTIVYEGPSSTKADRQKIVKKAKGSSYEPLIVWVQTESAAAKARATKQIDGKPAMSKDRFVTSLKQFSAPGVGEKAIVISGKHTYASQLKIVLGRLVVPKEEAVKSSSSTPRGMVGRRLIIH